MLVSALGASAPQPDTAARGQTTDADADDGLAAALLNGGGSGGDAAAADDLAAATEATAAADGGPEPAGVPVAAFSAAAAVKAEPGALQQTGHAQNGAASEAGPAAGPPATGPSPPHRNGAAEPVAAAGRVGAKRPLDHDAALDGPAVKVKREPA